METVLTLLASLARWALEIYEWIIIVAILLTWVAPDPSNPIVMFLNRMTVPLWNRLARVLPGALRLFSAYVSLLLVWFLKVFLPGVLGSLALLAGGAIAAGAVPVQAGGYFLLGIGIVVQSFLRFLLILLLVWFFLTLVNPSLNNPIVRTLAFLLDPFIAPIQKRLPRMRVDLSPLIAAAACLALDLLAVSLLINAALRLTSAGLAIPRAAITL
ncbi:MAG: YggT family protein [Candidatus Lambdaproteobacteria bacterium]|nr:YggT family protein [Candidatus Lambdaproteobacteria bacterium]